MLRPAQTLSISIAKPASLVYEFVADPQRLPLWAAGLGDRPTRLADGAWRVETNAGPMRVVFAQRNSFGVVDHLVVPLSGEGPSVDVPLRVVPNGTGSEVLLTLFQQAGMADEQFAADTELVRADLARLKRAVEQLVPTE